MDDEEYTKRWNNITTAAFIASIAVGIVVGYFTQFFNGVYTVLIMFGIYFAIYFHYHDDASVLGPSSADGAIMGAVLLCGVGLCGFMYYFTGDVTVTAIGFIAVLIAVAGVMVVRNRRFL